MPRRSRKPFQAESADGENSYEESASVIYLRLLRYLKPHLGIFILSILGFVLFAASSPLLAKLMGIIIHAIEEKNDASRWTLPLYAIGVFALRGLGSFIGTYFNALVSNRLVRAVRADMFSHLTTLPTSYFDQKSDGRILQRLTGGAGLLSAAITDALKVIIREGLTVLFLLGYVFYLNWKLSLAFLLVAPFMALVVRYTTKRFRDITRKDEGDQAGLMQTAKEMIQGNQVMRVFRGQEYEIRRYQQAADSSLKRRMKIVKISALSTPAMQLLVAVAMAAIIFMLLTPATLQSYSSGELITYLTAVALIPKSMRQLSGVNVTIQRGIAGAQLIFNLLDTPSEPDEGTFECARAKGKICVNDVEFRYKKLQEPVLRNISFDIQPGEMVALVGRSGSGKSTLASLLQRLYNADKGSIELDGINIQNYRLLNLRQQFSLVSQNLVLFNDTIRNNIAYGAMQGCSDEKILQAARMAHALEFIEKQPNGLDTIIGDNGLQLSGGQRQRIAIARALLKDAPILILDEATSALDNTSEKIIQQALDNAIAGRTTIVIAHRLSTIEKADNIIVMDDGKIIEQGKHSDLIAKMDSHYRKLYLSSQEGLLV